MVDLEILNFDNEADWLAERRKSLGSSEISDLILPSGRGPIWLWMQKNPNADVDEDTLEEVTEKAAPKVNGDVRRAMEPLIEAMVSERLGVVTHDPGDYCILRSGRDHVSPDALELSKVGAMSMLRSGVSRYIEGKRVAIESSSFPLELKTIHPFATHLWRDGEPHHVTLQCQQYMRVVPSWDKVVVGAFIGYGDSERDQIVLEVERHPELIQLIDDAAGRFWEHVDKDIMPEPDGFDSELLAIRTLLPPKPKGQGVTITLPESFVGYQQSYDRLSDEIEKKERSKAKFKADIEIMMGQQNAETAVVPATETRPAATWRRFLNKNGQPYVQRTK